LDVSLADAVDAATLEWAVPGLREGQVEELLRALPKSIRRQLMPLQPKVAEITRELRPKGASLKNDLAGFIRQRYGIEVPVSTWTEDSIPRHLRPRIEVLNSDKQPLATGRDFGQVKRQLANTKKEPPSPAPDWARVAGRWEKFGVTAWSFGDLPERILLDERQPDAGAAFPGLELEDGQINLRLFPAAVLARKASVAGVRALLELQLQKDLAWMQKDLRALSRFEPLLAGWISQEAFQSAAFAHLKAHLFAGELPALSQEHFVRALERARNQIPGLVARLCELIKPMLTLRQQILTRFKPKPELPAKRTLSGFDQLAMQPVAVARAASPVHFVVSELESLLPKTFLSTISFERLPHMPRYLNALLIRGERAALKPVKDKDRALQLAPYVGRLAKIRAQAEQDPALREGFERFRWMLEEFKVSLFAQELGTAFPISAKRIDDFLAANVTQ
jgi:ATP-dependent helicase HrpA